jgi:hypothetical protein
MDAGVEIQGKVCIKQWDDKAEDYIIHIDTDDYEALSSTSNCFEKRITHMYVADDKLNFEITEDE